MDTPSEEELIARGFRFVTEKPADKFHEIPGDDTVIRVYKKGRRPWALYPAQRAHLRLRGEGGRTAHGRLHRRVQLRLLRKDVSAGENFMIDLRAYGMDRASRRK
jgi:hypothetical protein